MNRWGNTPITKEIDLQTALALKVADRSTSSSGRFIDNPGTVASIQRLRVSGWEFESPLAPLPGIHVGEWCNWQTHDELFSTRTLSRLLFQVSAPCRSLFVDLWLRHDDSVRPI